jgi:hypothetical protein
MGCQNETCIGKNSVLRTRLCIQTPTVSCVSVAPFVLQYYVRKCFFKPVGLSVFPPTGRLEEQDWGGKPLQSTQHSLPANINRYTKSGKRSIFPILALQAKPMMDCFDWHLRNGSPCLLIKSYGCKTIMLVS